MPPPHAGAAPSAARGDQNVRINALVIGGLQRSLGVYLDEDSMIERLRRSAASGRAVGDGSGSADFQHRGRVGCPRPIATRAYPALSTLDQRFGTTRTLGVPPRPTTLEQETAWYEQAAVDDARTGLDLEERPFRDRQLWLHEVDLANRRTVVGIMIGEPDVRGRRYGTEAMRLLLDYAFTVLVCTASC